ncbi:hypothetical protein BWI97_13020 [Siphonobacter sp. BAB-5405]|nr:hypothetical protein BWI97_13020 [Siphonobacter sp. BAB-5405]
MSKSYLRSSFPFSVFRFPFSVFRFPFSVFRFPFSVFRFGRINPVKVAGRVVRNIYYGLFKWVAVPTGRDASIPRIAYGATDIEPLRG